MPQLTRAAYNKQSKKHTNTIYQFLVARAKSSINIAVTLYFLTKVELKEDDPFLSNLKGDLTVCSLKYKHINFLIKF